MVDMTGPNHPSDDAFGDYWANEHEKARSYEEAAWLPATMQAILHAWSRFSSGVTILLAEARRRTAEIGQ